MRQIRLSTIGIVYGGFLLLIGLCLIVGSLYVNQRITQVGQLWRQFAASHAEKPQILNALHQDIGYGGMIHHFKQMVLRRDASHGIAVQVSLGGALSAIERYRNLATSAAETAALDQLGVSLNEYRQATLKAGRLIALGLSAEEIDHQLPIDDGPTLRALDVLEAEVATETSADAANQADLLNRLRRYLGYGGMIHQFYDYLLHKDPPRAVLVRTKLAEAQTVVDRYKNLDVNGTEQKALAHLQHMLQSYQQALVVADELIAQKTPSAELIRYAAVDDAPALEALRGLTRETLAQAAWDAHSLQAGLIAVSTLALGNGMLTPILIWLMIGVSVWLLRSQIIQPLTRLTDAMLRLSKGDLGIDVAISGGAQEIRQLAAVTQLFKEKFSELAAAEKRMRQVLDSMPDPVVMVNEQGRFVMVNLRTEEVFGYTSEQMLGANVELLLPQHQRQERRGRAFSFGLAPQISSMTSHRDICVVTADGRELPVDINLNPIQTDQGTLILATIRDISAHKRIEAVLVEERSLIYSLVGSIRDIIFWKDVNGVYQGCNPAFTRAFGKTQQELIGLTDFDLYPKEIAESNWKQDQHLLKSRKPFQDEQICLMTDGREVILDTVLTPYTDEAGNLLGILGVSRDITQYKEMAKWLSQSKEQADAANLAKGEFLANMSHDIRTPMNAIIGLSQLALDTPLSNQQRDYLFKIHNAAQDLLGILNDILDFSKIDADKMQMESVDFDLISVLDQVTCLVGQKAEEKGLKMLFNYSNDLPTALIGDPLRLKQILTNLINNAVKFTEQGEIVVGIDAYEKDTEQVYLHFAVRDTGIGISTEQKSRLFQAFSQADTSTTRRHGGTGLGLVICKRLVEMMGGSIYVDSEPGQGSTFHFTAKFGLSLKQFGGGEPALAKPADLIVNTARYKPRFQGLRLLVVEDNPVNQQIAREFLCKVGLTVKCADNGQLALTLLQQECFDGVLMDMHMPEMDGLEITRRIRQQLALAELPIIAMTANAMTEDREHCLAAGMNDHIAKPVSMETLYETLAQWLPPARTDQATATVENTQDKPPVADPTTVELPKLVGFDPEQGLALMGGDLALYRTLLLMFQGSQKDCVVTLRQALANSDLSSAQTIAHTLRGLAANIGATSLTKAVERLESALKQSAQPDELVFLIAEAEQYLAEILAVLADWSAKQNAYEADDDDSDPSHGLFSKLYQILLTEQNGAMLAAINAATAAERLGIAASFAEVQRLVGEFDYQAAAKRLKELADELQIELVT